MSGLSKSYDRWSATYDAQDNPMIHASAWALDEVPFRCQGGDVLELGCGTGRHIGPVLDSGARSYVGVDASSGMLARARARPAASDPRVRLVEGDVVQLPFLSDSFDHVLVVLVLEHVTELEPLFAEISRLLRPGGLLRLLELHPSRIASGTVAHFTDAEGEVRFDSIAHPVAAITSSLRWAGLEPRAVRELVAEGALLASVPKLVKHAGRPVLLDLEAARAGEPDGSSAHGVGRVARPISR